MWLNFPVKIVGKIKTTPEQAKRMFGFNMKKDATGIFFQRRGNRICICNLVKRKNPKTEKQQIIRTKFATLGKITHKYKKEIIHKIWNPIAKHKYFSGQTMFIAVNMRELGNPPIWTNMKIADGEIEPPKILKATCEGKTVKIQIKNAYDKEVGIAVMETENFNLYHFNPRHYSTMPIEIKLDKEVHKPILYVYFKKGKQYSQSVSYSVLKICL
ncbi:MAG: hypothetical protein QMD71_04880 [bacterium]|nr:hypothetical protein [bacterium]